MNRNEHAQARTYTGSFAYAPPRLIKQTKQTNGVSAATMLRIVSIIVAGLALITMI